MGPWKEENFSKKIENGGNGLLRNYYISPRKRKLRKRVGESSKTILISFFRRRRNIIFPLRFCRIVKSLSLIFKIRLCASEASD
ncbi:hypothetical protein IGI04_025556 [Brassica rapa subsp. trilocularis]|uniref:Uncharacterized protein n=1 Tax=Brassica rapa subsp. trilocularis TaxID=1813537 RepID=A0ABQ7KWK1_BRACM|nr:hypothetical protein IGI04_025556 [Brassica rapa subsp. trilocularis]